MPFAGSSLFPIKDSNAEISPHEQCVFRRYAIIFSPTHPTKSRSLCSPCSTVAEAHACSQPSFVDGNESPSGSLQDKLKFGRTSRFWGVVIWWNLLEWKELVTSPVSPVSGGHLYGLDI